VPSVDRLYLCLDFNEKIGSFVACVCCSFPGFVLLDLRCFVAAVLLVFLIRQGLTADYFFALVSQFILPLRARAPRVVRLAFAFFLTDFSWG
jgi:hypothetical protein